MYAEIEIPAKNGNPRSQAAIPKSAILKGGSLPGVLVVNEDDRSELRIVRLGSSIDDARVSVLSGLKTGERIIDNPPPGVASGWMPPTHADAR